MKDRFDDVDHGIVVEGFIEVQNNAIGSDDPVLWISGAKLMSELSIGIEYQGTWIV